MRNCLTLVFLLFLYFATTAAAQQRSFNVLLGLPYATEFGGESAVKWKSKGGFMLGIDYWAKNKQGHTWSVGISYQSFKRKGQVTLNTQTFEQKETFEYFGLRGMPLTWMLDKQERWFIEAGGFANYLLAQETEVNGSVGSNADLFQKIYLGLSGGLGVRLGEPGNTALLVGLRNDLGLASFGSGPNSLKFNALFFYVGLSI